MTLNTLQDEDTNLTVSIIENDVIFFLVKNHKDSTNDGVFNVCKNYFPESEICDAKQWLADNYFEIVKVIDETAANNLLILRKGGRVTCKVNLVIGDIYGAIDALEASEDEYKFIAKDWSRIPNFKAENATML